MKIKSLVISVSMFSAIYANAGLLDAVGGMVANAASSNATAATKNTKQGNCVPRMNGGSVGMFDMVKEKLISAAITKALESMDGMKDVKIPKKIMDTCEADARLKYVETISNRYYQNLNTVNVKILAALEQTDEVKKLLADIQDAKSTSDKAALNEGIVEQTEKITKMLETAKAKDSKKVSEAQGIFFSSVPKYTALLAGWDKEIAEFAKDNLPWAIKNFTGVKNVVTQLKTIATIGVNSKNALTKLITNNKLKINKKAAKKAAKAMEKEDQKIIKTADKDFAAAYNS
jgi:hypothetical protein